MCKSLFVMVGDLSADRHAAKLIAKMRETEPTLHVWGVGGPKMREAGVETLAKTEDFAIIGIIETIKHLPFLNNLTERMVREVGVRKPDVVLLIDSGGFNLRFSNQLKRNHPELPILYFISPQLWGSRPWRINVIKRTVTKMFVIFPFEEELYTRKGVSAQFVGHPLLQNMPSKDELKDKESFCRAVGLDPERPIIAVFSGSRVREIKDLTPICAEAASWLLSERPELQFVFSKANERVGEPIDRCLAKHGLKDHLGKSVFTVTDDDNYTLMAAADIVWAKSGTTTLEVTLFGKPMLIFYRGMWISYWMFSAYKTVKRVGWPNLLAGELLVPELIQLDCRPEQFVRYTRDLLDVPALRSQIAQRLLELKDQLGQGDYVSTVAEEVLTRLRGPSSQATPG